MFFDIKIDSVALNALQGEAPHREPDAGSRKRSPRHADDGEKRKPRYHDAVLDYFSLDDLKKLVFKAIYFVVLRDPQLQGGAKVETLDKLCIDLHAYTPAEMVAYLHQAIAKLWRQGHITDKSYELLKPLEEYHAKLSGPDDCDADNGGTMFELFELLNGKRVDTVVE